MRTPEQTVGDIWSQVGAVELIAARLEDILAEYALPGIDDLARALFDRSEAAMRHAIARLPDGEYRYTMQTDGFGEPLRVRRWRCASAMARSSAISRARRRSSRAASTACWPIPAR